MKPLLAMVCVAIAILSTATASSHSPPHPLDSLSAAELTAISLAVHASPLVTARPLTIHYIGLDKPEKHDVLSYAYNVSSATILPRCALVIARASGQTHEIRVDVTKTSAPSVVSHSIHRGAGFPAFTTEELVAAGALPPKYPPFAESVRRRGLNLSDVGCGVLSKGWFGSSEDERWRGTRVAKMQCLVTAGTTKFYARPLEGVTLMVDIERKAIVGYRDRVVQPVPKAVGTEYRADRVGPPFTGPSGAPGMVVQPDGRGFQIDYSHVVRWANWEFHVGFDMRAGTVISLASVHDVDAGVRWRVLYRGFISEIFVPYMDPEKEWYFHTFLDTGDYGLGMSASPLQPGGDCPANAVYLDGYYVNQDGDPVKAKNVICVFERYAGDVTCCHREAALSGEIVMEVRLDVTLVARMVVTSGNYDYVLD